MVFNQNRNFEGANLEYIFIITKIFFNLIIFESKNYANVKQF